MSGWWIHKKEDESQEILPRPWTFLRRIILLSTGVASLLYGAWCQHQKSKNGWVPTTWSFFAQKLENKSISMVTLVKDLIFFQDTDGNQYKTGILPGSHLYLFQHLRTVPKVLSVPGKKFLPTWISSGSFDFDGPFQKLPHRIPFPTMGLLIHLLHDFTLKALWLVTGALLLNGLTGIPSCHDAMENGSDTAPTPAEDPPVTFKSIVGHEQAKNQLKQFVELVKNPQRLQLAGARLPRGVLLNGAPGTGKTLLARALAYEAQATFFHMASSNFVELYVGQGALRLRQLFAKAKKKAPCILFLDEIDSLGVNREVAGLQSHEYTQTLNQLLGELDGLSRPYTSSEKGGSVLVVAATNRLSVLDPALIRPGRFDKIITLQLPNQKEREELCIMYSRQVNMDPDVVQIKTLAQLTEGWTGAELECLFNEAALMALGEDAPHITSRHISWSLSTLNKRKHEKKQC